jgi:predicted transcriptional regulator
MTQEELATKAGIPQSHVCRLETGKHAPTYVTIQKVAKALRVKRSQLDPGFDD